MHEYNFVTLDDKYDDDVSDLRVPTWALGFMNLTSSVQIEGHFDVVSRVLTILI